MKYSVMLLKGFSTTVDVEADSLDEAIEEAFVHEPGDSVVGFDWEPDGETTAYVIYDEDGNEVWREKPRRTAL